MTWLALIAIAGALLAASAFLTDSELSFVCGCLLVSGAGLAWGVSLAIEDSRDWEKFRAEHGCRVVSHISGGLVTGVGVGGNGQPVVTFGSTPDKTGWLCDDGVTYYR